MGDVFTGHWADRYHALVDPQFGPLVSSNIADSGLFLCGMSACVDARIAMGDIRILLEAPQETRAAELATLLLARAAHGVGGEVRFDWPEGPSWLRDRLTFSTAIGGTGPQAAWVLSQLGVASLVALEDRHVEILGLIPSAVLLAVGDELKPASTVTPSGDRVPEVFIFEFTMGRPIGSVLPKRSSRIIVRFCDRGIQRDIDFEAISRRLAPTAAAGLLSGLNDESASNVSRAGSRIFALSRDWRAAGLNTIHFELAGYTDPRAVDDLLTLSRGAITSLGMSHSELLAIDPSASHPMEALTSLGDRLGLSRVCVHADGWAASVTTGDRREEELALMAGCAVAGARAASGAPASTITVAAEAEFEALPFEAPVRKGLWTFVACASPYIREPATTLGLGDSFTAGCLLMLARASRSASRSNP
jgi:hypothetical protein